MLNSRLTTPSSKCRLDVVPGIGEDHQHFAVFRQHFGAEFADAVFAGSGGQVFQQDGPDAAALVGVGYIEGNLGFFGIGQPVVAADAQDFPADGDHQRHPVLVVHLREALQLLAGEPRLEGEEPHVDGLLRLAGMESLHGVGIRGVDGAQMSRPAVPQNDIGFPIFRIYAVPGLIHHRLSLAKTPPVNR